MDADQDDQEPLRLDIENGAAAAPADDDRSDGSDRAPAGWRRWMIPAAAFVLGVVVSFVISDARRASEERSELDVVIGAQALRSEVGSPPELEYEVQNVGEQTVTIADIVPRGWIREDDGQRVGVAARPGEWTTVATAVTADCEERPALDVNVTARTRGGVVSTEAELPRELHDQLLSWWGELCPARELTDVEATFGDVVDIEGDTLTAVVEVTPHGTAGGVKIVEVEAPNQGFDAWSSDLPADLPMDEPTRVQVTWQVIDCDQALRLSKARLGITIATPEPRSSRVDVELDNAATVELARFSGGVCRT